MTLSTAQPMLNATPPELLALNITVVGRGAGAVAANAPAGQPGQPGMMGMGGMGGMGGGMASRQFRAESQALRKKAQEELIVNNPTAGGTFINDASALEQAE